MKFALFALLFLIATANAADITITQSGSGSITVQPNTLQVEDGGTERQEATPYAVITGGTDSTAAQQSVSSLGSTGDALKSAGAGALPTWGDFGFGASTSFTPTVDCGSDTEPVFTTNTGRKSVLGNIAQERIYLDGDGGTDGSGSTNQMTVATGVTAGANQPAGRFPCGYATGVGFSPSALWCTLTGGGTTVALERELAGSYTVMHCADFLSGARTIRIDLNIETN